jgi:hypothetical protein
LLPDWVVRAEKLAKELAELLQMRLEILERVRIKDPESEPEVRPMPAARSRR